MPSDALSHKHPCAWFIPLQYFTMQLYITIYIVDIKRMFISKIRFIVGNIFCISQNSDDW